MSNGVIMEEQQRIILNFDQFMEKLRKDREIYGDQAQARLTGVSRFSITRLCTTNKSFTVTSLLGLVRGYGGDIQLVFPKGYAIPPRLRRRRTRRLPSQ
jgi:hypothetical protein